MRVELRTLTMFGWWSLIRFLEAAQLMRPAPKENEMTRSFEPIIKHKQMSKQMMDWTEYWKRQRWMPREPTRTNPVNLFLPLAAVESLGSEATM